MGAAGAEQKREATERINHILQLMSENKWPSWPRSLEYRRALGKQWGVSECTVRRYAGVAHRMLSLSDEEKTILQSELAKRFFGIAEEALGNVNRVTGLPDYHAAIKAYEQMAKFVGIEPETKVRLSGAVSLEDVDSLRQRIRGVVPETQPLTVDEDLDEHFRKFNAETNEPLLSEYIEAELG